MLDRFVADLIDRLKVSSPKLFMVIAGILTALKFGLDGDPTTADIPSLEWGLSVARVDEGLSATISEWFTWVAALFITSNATAYLSDAKKERAIAKSKKIAGKAS